MVSTVGIHFRAAKVNGAVVAIAGIGGVMTHPSFRKQGLGQSAMLAAHDVISNTDASFGVLFCEPFNEHFYRHLGWRVLEGDINVEQKGVPIRYDIMTAMVRAFDATGAAW